MTLITYFASADPGYNDCVPYDPHTQPDLEVLMMRKRSTFLAIVLLFAAMSLSPLAAPAVMAQEAAVTIEYGDTVSGTITNDTPSVSYRFEGEMNDVVSIALQAEICGNLNPRLVLLNAAGVRLAEDDDGGPGVDALIYAFTLPQSGVYTIMAGRSGDVDGTTLGDFTLSLDSADYTEIAFGESARGAISPNGLPDLFHVDLTVGDLVRIGATSGDCRHRSRDYRTRPGRHPDCHRQ
ncbi:MAG: hypothetical protein M5R40_18120 [Anaerolineae bacterium]|nr:hypothetical protein [Anaerolineae bacterium]